MTAIDVAHLTRQMEWSQHTFGPGERTAGVIDGAMRAGIGPHQIIHAVKAKQARNEARTWPDWRDFGPGEAIEHDRTADA